MNNYLRCFAFYSKLQWLKQSRDDGFESCITMSKLAQVYSVYIAAGQSAVKVANYRR